MTTTGESSSGVAGTSRTWSASAPICVVALGRDRDHLRAAGPHLLDVGEHLRVDVALGGDRHDRHAVLDERDRAVLQLGGREPLRVDVADLLQLERALERRRIPRVPADEQDVARVPVPLGQRSRPRRPARSRVGPGPEARPSGPGSRRSPPGTSSRAPARGRAPPGTATPSASRTSSCPPPRSPDRRACTSTPSASRASDDPTVFVTAIRCEPCRRAWRAASSVSIVSPDWLTASVSVSAPSTGSR